MPADTEAVTGARRVARTVLALIAVTVMVGTGVAWGKIRSFEDGIFHMSTAALGGGGQDGAIDILLVGMDSHGGSLYDVVRDDAQSRRAQVLASLGVKSA